jgi:hypothetical protein
VIDGGAHWVVVAGYKLGSGASAVKIGGHNISGIYIRDPDDDGGSVRLIAIDPWLTLRLGPVLCTTPADANRSIVIVGRDN